MSNESISRRKFLRGSCATALALGGLSVSNVVRADAERLTEDDPTAKALGYVHDASATDVAKFPKRADEAGKKQFCYNCALYDKTAAEGAEWAGCSLFQNREVAANGWCNAWVAG